MATNYRSASSRDGFASPPRHAWRQLEADLNQANGTAHDADTNVRFSRDEEDASWQPSMSTQQEYPASRPLIHDDYRRDPSKRIDAYPENNRQAVMDALKSLQDKIRQLEMERSKAEKNISKLTSETTHYRDLVNQSVRERPEALETSSQLNSTSKLDESRLSGVIDTNNDLHTRLDSAEHRSKLLEKQLDYMRQMVAKAETDRGSAMQRLEHREHHHVDLEKEQIKEHYSKIQDLEKDHLRLTATQTLAESKIRELEQRLQEERHFRKMMQERTAEMETTAETNRIIREATGQLPNSLPAKKQKKRKKKTVTSSKYAHTSSSARNTPQSTLTASGRKRAGMEPPEHYKLNLANIPFVLGKSTAPSHSLAANFQEILSMMKSHNPRLCNSPRSHLRNGFKFFNNAQEVADNIPTRGPPAVATTTTTAAASTVSRPTRVTRVPDADLMSLLLQLQDEFGQMSIEHQELCRQIQDSANERLREDFERELDHLVAKMESKGEQIARLQRHHEMLCERNSKKKLRPKSEVQATGTLSPEAVNGQVEVTTTIRTRGKSASNVVVDPSSASRARASLNLYKGLKKIQTTLRKDDINWDC